MDNVTAGLIYVGTVLVMLAVAKTVWQDGIDITRLVRHARRVRHALRSKK